MRLVAADGSMLGVSPISDALRLAEEQGLDLVQVDPSSQLPVCRLMDYGATKFREQKKKRQSAAAPSKLKQLRLTPRTDKHDVALLINKARGFLVRKHAVKFNIIFRGRDRSHFQRGTELLDGIKEALKDLARIDANPKRESRLLSALFVPTTETKNRE